MRAEVLLKRITNKPIKTKVLIFFLPLIILSIILTSYLSYRTAKNQLQKNALVLVKNTVYQSCILINDKFSFIFGKLVALSENETLQNLIMNNYGEKYKNDRFTDIIKVNNYFNDLYYDNYPIIDSLYFCAQNGLEIKRLPDDVPRRIGINLSEWLKKYHYSDQGYYWLNKHNDTVFDTVNKRSVISTFYDVGQGDASARGLVIFNMNCGYFMDLLANIKVSSHGYILMISRDGVIQSRNTGMNTQLTSADLLKLKQKLGTTGYTIVKSRTGEKLVLMYDSIKINRWMLAAVVPMKDILKDAGNIKYISLVMIFILLFVTLAMAAFFAGQITNPIRYLSSQVKLLEKGDFDAKLEVEDAFEIGVLAHGLQRLVSSVKELIEKVKDEQEKKRKTELLALQSQINPHFLYNTLGSIKHLIDMEENAKASQMTSALTKFFMIGISRGKVFIPVKEELEHIENYLIIQKMRYSRDFDYVIDVDEGILRSEIIKLTLQPIVENSIYHGMKNKMEMGIIRITGWREQEDVVIEVFDEGAGMDAGKLGELMRSINNPEIEETPITFGLRNVNQRIKLHYGEEFGIEIQSAPGEYTRVRLRIPYKSV